MEPHLRAAPRFGSAMFSCIEFVCMSIVNVHIGMCVDIGDMNKNAYKLYIFWYSKYQKVLSSNVQGRSTPWVYTVMVFSLVLCAFAAGS